MKIYQSIGVLDERGPRVWDPCSRWKSAFPKDETFPAKEILFFPVSCRKKKSSSSFFLRTLNDFDSQRLSRDITHRVHIFGSILGSEDNHKTVWGKKNMELVSQSLMPTRQAGVLFIVMQPTRSFGLL